MSTTARTPSARVSALRALSVVLAFTAAVGLVFGTAGFTAMEADRGVDVNVTNVNESNLTGNVHAQTVVSTSDQSGDGNHDQITVVFKDDGGNLVPAGDLTANVSVRP